MRMEDIGTARAAGILAELVKGAGRYGAGHPADMCRMLA